jgi:hypothetical protein
MQINRLSSPGTTSDFDSNTREWKTWVRIMAGLICLLAVFSHHPLDPSPYNLLKSYDAIHNWLSYPGALIGGFLVDHWGSIAYGLPVLWMFTIHRKNLGPGWGLLLDAIVLTLAAIGTGLILAAAGQPLLRHTGLVGYLAGLHLSLFPGSLLCWSIIAGFLIRHRHDYRLNPRIVFFIYEVLGVLAVMLIGALRFGAAQTRVLLRSITVDLPEAVKPTLNDWQCRVVKQIQKTWPSLKRKAADPPVETTRKRKFITGWRLPDIHRLLTMNRHRTTAEPSTANPSPAIDNTQLLHILLIKHEKELLDRSLTSPIMHS